jgi:hypothetical protein
VGFSVADESCDIVGCKEGIGKYLGRREASWGQNGRGVMQPRTYGKLAMDSEEKAI